MHITMKGYVLSRKYGTPVLKLMVTSDSQQILIATNFRVKEKLFCQKKLSNIPTNYPHGSVSTLVLRTKKRKKGEQSLCRDK